MMDIDASWCPSCQRQIQPKRYTVQYPVPSTQLLPSNAPLPAPPPPSPRKPTKNNNKGSGLVNGTGRLRHNGTIKAPPPLPPPVVMKQRLVIDQGPIPLYCSDECQLADIHSRPREELDLELLPTRRFESDSSSSASSSASSSSESSSSLSSPPKPLTSIQKLSAMYNLPPLPPLPPSYPPSPSTAAPKEEYTSGTMMAGKLITSLCPKAPAKPHVGKYRPTPEPRKPIPGWNDGSNAWRSTIYGFSPPSKAGDDPFNRDGGVAKAYGGSGSVAASHRPSRTLNATVSSSYLPSTTTTTDIPHTQSDSLISKFSENFTRRCESRTSLYSSSHVRSASSTHSRTATPTTPTSPLSTQSMPPPPMRRERSLVHATAEGKLLVPNVNLTVRVHSERSGERRISASSGSLSSGWSGPTSASSRRSSSVRSPLSVSSGTDVDVDEEDGGDAFPSSTSASASASDYKRPTIETRSWSYDNVQTYPIMQLPPKMVKKLEVRVVDGEEREVEVMVEAPREERKRLFLFKPSRISQ